MSLPQKAKPQPVIRGLQQPASIARGPVQQTLEERIYPPQAAVATVQYTVPQVPRQAGPAAYTTYELNKGHPNFSATPPGHASSPGLSQAAFQPGQNAAPPPLVYSQNPQTMTTQPQTRQGGFRPIQFFQRPPMQAARPSIPNNNPSMRPGTQTATAAVYPPNQAPIIMMNPSVPYPPAPQAPYYIANPFRPSATPYMGPPQQYSVQPPPGPFFSGPGPGDFTTYASETRRRGWPQSGVQPLCAPSYYSQPVYSPSAPLIVPTQPPPPPTKREKKTIRIRDPNQGGKDVTEEILSGGGGSRNPTPPVVRPSSTPTPPQFLCPHPHYPHLLYLKSQQLPSQVPDHGPVFGTAENAHMSPSVDFKQVGRTEAAITKLKTEEKPKQEPPVKSASPDVRPETVVEKKVVDGEPPDPDPVPLQVEEEEEEEEEVEEEEAEEEVTTEPASSFSIFPPLDSTEESSEPSIPKEEQNSAPNLCLQGEVEDDKQEERDSASPPGEMIDAPANEIIVPATINTTNDINGIAGQEVTQSTLESGSQDLPPPSTSVENADILRTAAKLEMPPSPVAPCTSLEVATEEENSEETPVSDDKDQDLESKESAEVEEKEVEENESQQLNSTKSPEIVYVQIPLPAPKMQKKPKESNKLDEEILEASEEPKEEELAVENTPEAEQDGSVPDANLDKELDIKMHTEVEENGDQELEPEQNGSESVSESESTETSTKESPDDSLVSGFKEEQWKILNPEGKKRYDREFLLGFQFIAASTQKPDGLPAISDVVLDKINQTKQIARPLDPSRLLPRGPDFTPSYADFGRQPQSGRAGVVSQVLNVGPRRSQHGQRREPRKIIANISVNDDIQLKKSENAWKPTLKREDTPDDSDLHKTQELFRRVRSILNKLTPQMFQQLMKQVQELTIDTEERLKGVIDLVFEKAIDEPNFSVAYANMCRCLTMLKVPMSDKPGATVNFRKLLLNRCQKEFEKDKADDVVNEKRQKEIDATAKTEEKSRLQDELEESKDKARRRSIGNIKFIGELFKLKMLTEAIMHDCVVKLLKNHDEESLECLCRLLTTIGKDLDFEKAKPRMDQYFNQMEKIVKERKTSSRIRFMLQDVIDVRMKNWVSRRVEQGPKTIEQIHKEAQIEEQQQQLKVHQQLLSKQDKRRPGGGRPTEEVWNTVPVAKSSRTIDPSKFPKITKPATDDKIQLGPGCRLGSWGKGSSGGVKTNEPELPRTTSLNRFSVLQQSTPPSDSDTRRTLPSRSSTGREKNDKPARPAITRVSSNKELFDDRAREEERREVLEIVQQTTSTSEEKSVEGDRNQTKENVKPEVLPADASPGPSLSEEEMEKKSKSIIDEFLHINDYKEALQCVDELNSLSLLHVFVRVGVESTLERSQITREHMGQLFYQLIQAEKLPKDEFFKGFLELLELAEDMAIDIPHIWLYLGELVTPMLQEGGISMRELFTELSKPLLPVERTGVLLAEILHLLCKQMSHKKVGALWKEAGLNWKDFLTEGEDVQHFISDKKLEFTVSDVSSPTEALSKMELSAEELNKWLEKLIIEDKASNEQIFDWVEANLDESQIGSSTFLRALMTTVCRSAITGEGAPSRVDANIIQQRLRLLLKYLNSDTERELQALYALQALIVKLDQPPNLLRMFFDTLYDEDVISEDAFYKWENSKDPAEQNGKGVALKSVTAFFTWLREAEEESEDN
ncbi:eukaryotic translation initiation factor 4 gamma 3-like isoform X6 [Scyliorhinus canicula]|uniref:eukaryotic translation initiation factor 4 gamma 3-like isoform X6 n=1 Tax=Scyliorhinus canicula TaxID=7830 RepID=UPI0018F4D768|nr:eukaryotic translation initiation factor 4 gamma 3-like isoform X6 [Scyliorhinus canicula]